MQPSTEAHARSERGNGLKGNSASAVNAVPAGIVRLVRNNNSYPCGRDIQEKSIATKRPAIKPGVLDLREPFGQSVWLAFLARRLSAVD